MSETSEHYVGRLRAAVGHDPLWLTSVTAVVVDASHATTLLVTRPATGLWAPVAAVLGPGEEPARAAVAAVRREAGLEATPRRLAWVHATRELTYPSGDRAQYVNLVFLLEATGEPGPDARWCALDALPHDMGRDHVGRITAALAAGPATRFEFAPPE